MAKKSLGRFLRQVCKLAAVQTARESDDRALLERFVAQKDEAAFAVLVERHGRMVLGVCRRVLGSSHDAEDACQTTFLVLAQKAGSIRKTTALPSWLHGVAARVAAQLRRESMRRRQHEHESPEPAVADAAAEVSWREVQAVLDEELERLPERLRAPLVLCYLDGRARDEAARLLGVSVPCLHGRLERGRKALCERLTRRGIALSAALLATAVGEGVARAALAPAMVLRTAKAAVLLNCGRALDNGLISAKVLSLSQEVATTMFSTKLKWGLSALLCTALLATALGGSLASSGAGGKAKAPPAAGAPQAAADAARRPAAVPVPQAAPPKGAARPTEEQRLSGRVLDPDGKPVAGAKVYLLQWGTPGGPPPGKAPPKVWAETDKDGRFSFTAPRYQGELFVTAAGFGPGWEVGGLRSVVRLDVPQETAPAVSNLVVRLARDDVPVSGRLLDLQGQPVAGATVRVFSLHAPPDGSLDKWIAAVKNRQLGRDVREDDYLSSFFVDGLAFFFPQVTTDRDGRFRIRGIGRERVAAFTVEGPTLETRVLHVVTRPGLGDAELRVPESSLFFGDGTVKELRQKPYYPPTFTHTADPCRVLTGVVRDKDSGKPVAGAVVRGEWPVRFPAYYNRTTTDKEGRYRLTGLPLVPSGGPSHAVVALPPTGKPYLALRRMLPADPDAKEATFDFDLPRGVRLEGQVRDRATGRGVLASLRYLLFTNPTAGAGTPPGAAGETYYKDPYDSSSNQTDNEGRFRMVVVPGRGVLGATALGEQQGRYRTGVGGDKIEGLSRIQRNVFAVPFGAQGFPPAEQASPDQFDILAEVKAEKGASVKCDLELDPGRTLTVQVRGPDGKPRNGVQVDGQFAHARFAQRPQEPVPAEFTVYGLEPGKGRTLLLEHPGEGLAARCDLRGDERGPVVVTLQPAAAVVGRLVDDNGLPVAHADLSVRFFLAGDDVPRSPSRPFRTDAKGKFPIDGLIPAVPYKGYYMPLPVYSQQIFDDLSLKSGETKDLGDLTVKKGDSQ
jgi:RNA polymerase sigma factor (sigma-70 family)